MLAELSFLGRLGILLLFCVVASLFDLKKAPRQRHRWREYLLLWMGLAAGAAAGMLFDAVTSSLSPEYFEHGKQIARDGAFFKNVLRLGAEAGAGAGVVVGAVLLLANRSPGESLRLCRYFWIPFVAAATLGCALGTLQWLWPIASMENLVYLVGSDGERRFLTVWMTHFGIYGGAVFGLIVAAVRLRRSQQQENARDRAAATGV
ncbi:MAG: hypothetical protein AAF581_20430 [Planctomycetota bacterium]